MPKKKKTEAPVPDIPVRPVTLRDIAKELGVSHVTVSLALRDHPRISEATRARVRKKAEEMGYHPDPMLSALSHYRLTSKDRPVQATLAWINPLREPERIHELKEFSLYWKGAQAAAQKLGFHLEEFTTKEFSLQRLSAIFKTRNIRGLIIAPLSRELDSVSWNNIPWQDFAAVECGRNRQAPPLHIVSSAQSYNARIAFEKILEKGYKRIGMVSQPDRRKSFVDGYLRAQLALSKEQQLPPIFFSDEATETEKREFAAWLKKHRPDAILAASPHLFPMLKHLDYRIPEDIGVATISVHDTPINAGIDQNPEEIGRVAVRTLVSLLNEHHFGIPEIRNQILIEGRWKDGDMLPPRV